MKDVVLGRLLHSPRWNNWLDRGIDLAVPGFALVLLASLGVVCAQIFWSMVVPDAGLSLSGRLEARNTPPSQTPEQLAGSLAKSELFGTPDRDDRSATTVRPTRMAIRLEGVITGSGPSVAIMKVDNRVRVVTVGDTVAANVTLKAIRPDQVILDHDGRLESVVLPKAKPALSLFDKTPPPHDRTEAPASLRRLSRGPRELLKHVSFAPVRQRGSLHGYRIMPVSGQQDVLEGTGLHPGDIVTHIDGQPLTDLSGLPGLLEKVRAGNPIRLHVMRHGQSARITIDPYRI